jgi:hypothetical protein
MKYLANEIEFFHLRRRRGWESHDSGSFGNYADNFVTNAGSGGSTFASDDIGSVQFPRIKLVHGADGTNDGDISTANPLPVRVLPTTANGCDVFRSLDLDETEEDVKTTAGTVYGLWFSNTATATRFLKFYNATAANVTVGTTTPVLTLALPGNTSDDVSGVFSIGAGIKFSTAICVAATTGLADNDTGAPSANDVIVNIFYA